MVFQYKKALPALSKQTAHVFVQSKKFSKIPSLSKAQNDYLKSQFSDRELTCVDGMGSLVCLVNASKGNAHTQLEKVRIIADKVATELNKHKIKSVTISSDNDEHTLACAEGLALGNYQFLKYYGDKSKRQNSLKTVACVGGTELKKSLVELKQVYEAVKASRDLVNEPVSYLTAPQIGKEIKSLSKTFGFKAEVWGRAKITSMKMGGLLAVNKGSLDDPSFSTLTWKPANAVNKKPIVLVGKGVVYDTGGLSLKPTPHSMDMMKSDMGGAAAVIGAMCAIAGNKIPVHVIALVPSTDNRPGGNAYAPGDVITMFDGSTVEVLNTDAEGRMILADALAYAKKFKPELVVDAATLTGAAARAIGKHAIVGMGNADNKTMSQIKEAGESVGEPIVEFPFWDVYADDLKSTIADQKNLGGPEAGAITAGKFLEKFTDYPYVHLDIAGPAFVLSRFNYRGIGGTGVGVRLLYQFIKNKVIKA